MSSFERKAWAALALLFCAFLSGCGTPGAPQPPSLNLPDPVADLSAIRTGDKVRLTWTNPKRNTDRTAVKPDVKTRILRREGTGSWDTVGTGEMTAPGKPDSFDETLPNSLASGPPRPINYVVELRNRRDRSAGKSNAATILAGAAPMKIEGLKAEARKQGVVLSWTPDGRSTAVRLQRRLLTPLSSKAEKGLMAPAAEPLEQNLLVDTGSDLDSQGGSRAIDETVRLNETYEYRAQRVSRVDADGKQLELAGELSAPIDIEVKDVFPPAVPSGLAAVAAAAETGAGPGAGPAIDLSWQPDTEPDLAGYIVYRREDGGDWQRISPATPGIEPAFHDAHVQPNHTYHYAVSAADKGGHESDRSAEAQETVPEP
jgi:hypothetical protein